MAEKLTGAQAKSSEQAILALISTGRTTFFAAYRAANVASGYQEFDQHSPCYRFADRFLQKHRKAGNIISKRGDGYVFWELTVTGRAVLTQTQDTHED